MPSVPCVKFVIVVRRAWSAKNYITMGQQAKETWPTLSLGFEFEMLMTF